MAEFVGRDHSDGFGGARVAEGIDEREFDFVFTGLQGESDKFRQLDAAGGVGDALADAAGGDFLAVNAQGDRSTGHAADPYIGLRDGQSVAIFQIEKTNRLVRQLIACGLFQRHARQSDDRRANRAVVRRGGTGKRRGGSRQSPVLILRRWDRR